MAPVTLRISIVDRDDDAAMRGRMTRFSSKMPSNERIAKHLRAGKRHKFLLGRCRVMEL